MLVVDDLICCCCRCRLVVLCAGVVVFAKTVLFFERGCICGIDVGVVCCCLWLLCVVVVC